MTDKELAYLIAEKLSKYGGKTYFVGGCVRDELLCRENKDIDIEVHCITPNTLENVLSNFGEVTQHGVSFGIYGIKGFNLDIAIPRREKKNGKRHTDFNVDIDPFIGEFEASKRRDFTINSLMQDVLSGKILDFWGGKSDIANKRICYVDSKTFAEDALRVLRAAQFAARFYFDVVSKTIELCQKIDLSSLSKERVFEEIKKALLKAEHPSQFFTELRKMSQLDIWFPELKTLIGAQQNQKYHQEGDVWTHTMLVLDEAAKLRSEAENPLGLMLSALCHDLGKPESFSIGENGIIHSYKHEEKGIIPAENFLNRITSEKELKKYVSNMILLHQQPSQKANNNSHIKSTNKMFDFSVSPNDLLLLAESDSLGRTPSAFNEKEFLTNRLNLFKETMSKPYVMGKDLVAAGLEPGKYFADILNYAHKLRLARIDKANALRQTLAYAKKAKK